jgi:hypothetical protein
MISYDWDHQATMQRLNAALQRRGYRTWFDMEQMKGSTIDAMSDAVERAAAMLYAITVRAAQGR